MRHMTQWWARCVVLVATAFALGALNGCASTGADGGSEPKREKGNDGWDHPPGYVPFSA